MKRGETEFKKKRMLSMEVDIRDSWRRPCEGGWEGRGGRGKKQVERWRTERRYMFWKRVQGLENEGRFSASGRVILGGERPVDGI